MKLQNVQENNYICISLENYIFFCNILQNNSLGLMQKLKIDFYFQLSITINVIKTKSKF